MRSGCVSLSSLLFEIELRTLWRNGCHYIYIIYIYIYCVPFILYAYLLAVKECLKPYVKEVVLGELVSFSAFRVCFIGCV